MARHRKANPGLVVGLASDTRTVNYMPGLNLRAEPSTNADILRVMRYMENVEPDTEREAPDGWMAVKGGGYCMTEYLK